MNAIKFYRVSEPYGEFSNFAPFPIQLGEKVWPTAEHFFQAQKFAGTDYEEAIRQTKSPMIAARMGRSRQHPIRKDWDEVKDDIMRHALWAKFTQHLNLGSLLLSTKDAQLIEHTRNDAYWGDGGDGLGTNRLGLLLMELRDALRKKTSSALTKRCEINYLVGDATQPTGEGPRIIVHVCNDIGGWGRGFVIALSKRWPEPEQRYRAWFRGEEATPFELGEVQFVQVADNLWVANLIGQRDVRSVKGVPPIRYDALRVGLQKVAFEAERVGASVHMPRIGCGLAGGKWDEVEGIVRDELIAARIEVFVYNLPTDGSAR